MIHILQRWMHLRSTRSFFKSVALLAVSAVAPFCHVHDRVSGGVFFAGRWLEVTRSRQLCRRVLSKVCVYSLRSFLWVGFRVLRQNALRDTVANRIAHVFRLYQCHRAMLSLVDKTEAAIVIQAEVRRFLMRTAHKRRIRRRHEAAVDIQVLALRGVMRLLGRAVRTLWGGSQGVAHAVDVHVWMSVWFDVLDCSEFGAG